MTRPRLMAGRVVAGLAIVTGVASLAAPASAHAVLLGTDPADQASLDEPPERVTLEFNEPVSVARGGLRVYDSDAHRVDDGEPDVSGAQVSVPLAGDLGDGAFVVSWRVVSADGHPLRGAFTFSVGDVAAIDDDLLAQLIDQGGDRPWEIAAAVNRFFAYGGVLLAAGGALFLVFVHDGGSDRRRLTRIVVGAAVVGGVALLAGLPIQATLATGLGASAIFQDGVLGEVLGDGVGWAVAAGLAGLGLVVAGSTRTPSSSAGRLVAVAGAVLAAGSFSLTGHTRTSVPVWLATITDFLHLLAVATWFGGLVVLATALLLRRDRPVEERAVLVVRFSTLAAGVLAVVLAAGLTLGWFEVRAVRALTSTTYGWLMLVKVAIVALVIAVAAWNRWSLLPAIRAKSDEDGKEDDTDRSDEDDDRAWAATRLRRAVTFEVAGLIAVVGVTALLVNVTPARVEAGVGTTYLTTVPMGDGSVNIVVDPNRVGRNSIHLYLSDATGRPGTAEEMTVEMSMPAADIGPLRRRPVDIGSGHWLLSTDDLSIGGRWRIDVIARVDQFTEETATTDVVVNP